MDEMTLITTARGALNRTETAFRFSNYDEYAQHMQNLLDLLIEELVGSAPGTPNEAPAERTQ